MKFKHAGFVVLGFPCNQWNEEPGSNQTIKSWYENRFKITFQLFSPVNTTGL